MTSVTTKPELSHPTTENHSHLFEDWFDPIETVIRDRVRGLIEEMICAELDAVLSRPRYGRRAKPGECDDAVAGVTGHRHGSRTRTLTGTFGKTEIAVPRARLNTPDGKTTEWKSGGSGLESAIAAVWDSVPVQRCTVHKHRNLLAHGPPRHMPAGGVRRLRSSGRTERRSGGADRHVADRCRLRRPSSIFVRFL